MTFSFEEKLSVIDGEIAKRRNKWRLSAIADVSWEDVAQILRFHIFKKWHLWDQSKPLENWLNRVITHQISNLIRNNYGNYAPPCSKCSFNEGGDLCGYTISGKKNSECPLFKKWEKGKKNNYEIKLAQSIDDPDLFLPMLGTVDLVNSNELPEAIERFHLKIEKYLNKEQYKIYIWLYVDHLSETQVAEKMKYKTSEKGRNPGYKQIYNIKRKILEAARKVLEREEIFYEYDSGTN